ncbi:dihydroorotate dehydrogenase [Cytobacillus sp. IB215665]|uniref:dihydroorotate dehydrogenase n=1 Tax=Cytobacillus sp. IB215665 TaxID=3097357 RepID=UPI002A0F4E66|nr:dihydroorotate dehydrogenase [Cytobacillus sp. IB215665]MDX8366370.1 dihydroorotate dehydrogenase [Cytobacillus sp. IB215665]
MPDWSYHQIFKPVIKHLSSTTSREFIHKSMNMVASLPGGHHIINFLGREESSPLLTTEVSNIHFNHTVGLSGKIDPMLSGTKAFSNLGFSFLEIGPITIASKKGTPPVVNFQEEDITFSNDFESIGLEATKRKLHKLKPQQKLLMRLVGNEQELNTLMSELDELADVFIIQADMAINENIFSTTKPIYVATPIQSLNDHTLDFFETFDGIVLDEDWLTTNITDDLIKKIGYLKTSEFTKPIITVGGVKEPNDALLLLEAGADLIMLSNGYVFAGPGLTKRINEAVLTTRQEKITPELGWKYYWLFGLFIFIGGIIALIISLTSVLLPYDEQFLRMNKESIWIFNERILLFMSHDRMTLAGTMISGGIVYMNLASYGVKKGLLWAKQAIDLAAITGFLGIFLFIGYGYFDWLHLLFWLLLLPFYVLGFLKTKGLTNTPTSTNTKNHKIWKQSLFGQLAFVMLGFSFVLGGVIISYIGVTSVFVATDLLYICMPPEVIQMFNERLTPVIAHDRAGFGSALFSVGLLVLTVSLWGFQQGNKWVWWTLFIGGIPAFITGISIHIAIGYTTFIHLLPAYIVLILFFIGLIWSYRFFQKRTD